MVFPYPSGVTLGTLQGSAAVSTPRQTAGWPLFYGSLVAFQVLLFLFEFFNLLFSFFDGFFGFLSSLFLFLRLLRLLVLLNLACWIGIFLVACPTKNPTSPLIARVER